MDYRIRRTIEFIEMNYHRPISVDDLSQCARLSRSWLDILFKSETGMSPVKYLKQFRISKAKDLLASDPDLGIKEVIARVGLTDRSHFARDFKQTFGVAPSECRMTGCTHLG